MKKLFFILISSPLFFSNCQQNNPSPPASPLPPACCTFNEPNLTYNPVWQIQGVTDITCNDAAVITNSSGDITRAYHPYYLSRIPLLLPQFIWTGRWLLI